MLVYISKDVLASLFENVDVFIVVCILGKIANKILGKIANKKKIKNFHELLWFFA